MRSTIIFLSIIAFAIIGKAIMARKKPQTTRTTPSVSLSPTEIPWYKTLLTKKGWEENELVVILAFPLFHLVGYAVAPEWWVVNILMNMKIWVLQLTLLIFGLMIPAGKGFIHHKLGKVGVVIVALAIPIVLILQAMEAKALPPDTTVKKTVEDFWWWNLRAQGKSDDQLKKEAEQMIAIALKETQFNQYETDGITPLRSKRKGYVCVMQLDEVRWSPQAEVLGTDYDMSTLDGCLKMALWVRQHMGVEVWSQDKVARRNANHKPIRVVAPVPSEWSEKIATPGQFRTKEDGPLTIMTSHGSVNDESDIKVDLGQTSWVQFQSRKENDKAEKPVNVTVFR